MQELRSLVSEIPDFPKPGILFRDISPLLRTRFGATIAALDELFTENEWADVDVVAGIESRGFILAWTLAAAAFLGVWLPFHPFDLLYNHVARHPTGTRPLPHQGLQRHLPAESPRSGWLPPAGSSTPGRRRSATRSESR